MIRRCSLRLCSAGEKLPPIAVLGLKPNASQADIKRAYRTLAKKHHPDAGGDADRFQQIQEAYSRLEEAKWDASTGVGAAAADAEEAMRNPGFDPTKARVKNYAAGIEAAGIRLVMAWCLIFTAVRLVLHKLVFPPLRSQHEPEEELGDSPVTAGRTGQPDSQQQQGSLSATASGWATPAPSDPLARAYCAGYVSLLAEAPSKWCYNQP